MHSADADQVRDAGGTEQLPVLALDGGLVAHGQRGQHAGGAGIGHLALQRVTQVLAQAVGRMADAFFQQLRRLPALDHPHVAGGAHALLEPQQFHVEAVGVQAAVRLLQAQWHAPALAGAQGRAWVVQPGFIPELGVPAQGQPGRQHDRLAAALRRLHVEQEAGAGRPGLRQAGHHAGDQQVLAFERGRQTLRDAGIGTPGACCRRPATPPAGTSHHARRNTGSHHAASSASTAATVRATTACSGHSAACCNCRASPSSQPRPSATPRQPLRRTSACRPSCAMRPLPLAALASWGPV